MTALALASGAFADEDLRRDAVRWGSCLAIVVAVYVGIFVGFRIDWSSDDSFGVDAPAVLLDLPESFVVQPPPEETEPPPPEEIKPPEEAELPEPPKPEPQEQKPVPLLSAPPVAVVHRWETDLVAHIERFKRYPPEARARGEQGLARIAFTVDRGGWIHGSHVVRSSGMPDLDQEALDMLMRAQPLPRPPDRIPGSELSFVIPVRFNIR